MWQKQDLSVLKRSVPRTLAFAFGSRLRSKTQRSKTRVLVRRLPNGKPQERLRFRDLRGKTLAFKKRIVIISCVLEASLGARVCVQALCVQKTRHFAFAFLSPLRSGQSCMNMVQRSFQEALTKSRGGPRKVMPHAAKHLEDHSCQCAF